MNIFETRHFSMSHLIRPNHFLSHHFYLFDILFNTLCAHVTNSSSRAHCFSFYNSSLLARLGIFPVASITFKIPFNFSSFSGVFDMLHVLNVLKNRCDAYKISLFKYNRWTFTFYVALYSTFTILIYSKFSLCHHSNGIAIAIAIGKMIGLRDFSIK